jgi:hypothetical protein
MVRPVFAAICIVSAAVLGQATGILVMAGNDRDAVEGSVVTPAESEAAKKHWTPDRMRDAKDQPLLPIDPKNNGAKNSGPKNKK